MTQGGAGEVAPEDKAPPRPHTSTGCETCAPTAKTRL
jgi:hypothetical protein